MARFASLEAPSVPGLFPASVRDIAVACGFCSQAHLTNAFRRPTRTTPTAWRRERRG